METQSSWREVESRREGSGHQRAQSDLVPQRSRAAESAGARPGPGPGPQLPPRVAPLAVARDPSLHCSPRGGASLRASRLRLPIPAQLGQSLGLERLRCLQQRALSLRLGCSTLFRSAFQEWGSRRAHPLPSPAESALGAQRPGQLPQWLLWVLQAPWPRSLTSSCESLLLLMSLPGGLPALSGTRGKRKPNGVEVLGDAGPQGIEATLRRSQMEEPQLTNGMLAGFRTSALRTTSLV
ncbi:uncharacterized protein [Castor canadensis]|uniref:Uncharacterized protein n=1 Tax=Castor canadensis TaxID=51338 RepID=A0AC58N1R3_CASCN